MTVYQVSPTKWTNRPKAPARARSTLPMPYVISDIMEPTEQVDGRMYTSKRAFRAVGRALGLTEVGDQKFKPKVRSTALRETKARRRAQLEQAVAQYKQGRRAKRG